MEQLFYNGATTRTKEVYFNDTVLKNVYLNDKRVFQRWDGYLLGGNGSAPDITGGWSVSNTGKNVGFSVSSSALSESYACDVRNEGAYSGTSIAITNKLITITDFSSSITKLVFDTVFHVSRNGNLGNVPYVLGIMDVSILNSSKTVLQTLEPYRVSVYNNDVYNYDGSGEKSIVFNSSVLSANKIYIQCQMYAEVSDNNQWTDQHCTISNMRLA